MSKWVLLLALLLCIGCGKDDPLCEKPIPAGDLIYSLGSGECYQIAAPCHDILGFIVYDRWGTGLYSCSLACGDSFCWMGTDNDDSKLLVGVYSYIIQFGDENGGITNTSGRVTLLE